MKIGDRLIGDGHPAYIIAEAGVNHDGSLSHAHELIDAARMAGADAVKFQFFSAERLVSAGLTTCAYQATHDGGAHQRDMLRRLELGADDMQSLAAHARCQGITFLATPFGVSELWHLVREIGVCALKIASPDLVNPPLLEAACDSRLPMIVSTGASDESEISAAVELIQRRGAIERLMLLHCVSAYPTPRAGARLRCIQSLRTRFGRPTGFSDHTMEETTGAEAVFAGACVLEKHLTLDRRRKGPDHFFSLEPAEFRTYVESVRSAEAMLGDGRLAASAAECEVRELARGRLIACRDIRAGELASWDVITVQRAESGLCASSYRTVIGRPLVRSVSAGTPISDDLLGTAAPR